MEDLDLLASKLGHMRIELIDLMDRTEMFDRAGLGGQTGDFKTKMWDLRVRAYRILVKLFDAGNDVRGPAAGFGWSSEHLESESMRNWLCPSFKSEETPYLSSHHSPIGHEGLWHTPSKKVPEKQQLPAYIQNVRNALMRAGHGEQEAHAMAVAAVKRWAKGKGAWGKKGKPTPVVREAAQRAVAEWEKLKASHHTGGK